MTKLKDNLIDDWDDVIKPINKGFTQKEEKSKNILKENKEIKPKLILTPEILSNIYYHHILVDKKTEWCGALIYTKVEGDFNDLTNLKFKAINFFPLDIGSHSYTEAQIGDMQPLIYDAFPELLDSIDPTKDSFRIGLIHTHHDMSTFFSGEDLDELKHTTPHHLYYVSLIVNYDGSFSAKLCLNKTKISENIITYLNDEEKEITEKTRTEEKFIETYDLSILVQNNNTFVVEQLKKLQEDKKVKNVYNSKKYYPSKNSYSKVGKSTSNISIVENKASILLNLGEDHSTTYNEVIDEFENYMLSNFIWADQYITYLEDNLDEIIDLTFPSTYGPTYKNMQIKKTFYYIKNNQYKRKKLPIIEKIVDIISDYIDINIKEDNSTKNSQTKLTI